MTTEQEKRIAELEKLREVEMKGLGELRDWFCRESGDLQAFIETTNLCTAIRGYVQRLEAKLAYRDSTQGTHSEECWRVHWECAVRKVEHLQQNYESIARVCGQHPDIPFEALLSFISSYLAVKISPETWARVQEEARSDG